MIRTKDHPSPKWRILFYISGLFLLTLGIAFIVQSNFGMGPWDLVNDGLTKKFGFTFGFWLNVVACTQVLIGGLLRWKKPDFTVLITSLVMGVFIDAWLFLLKNLPNDTYMLKLGGFLLGAIIVAIGVATYLVSQLPPSPVDYFMLGLKERFNLSVGTAKIASEACALVFGILLGGKIGLGTLLILFIIGPMIQILLPYTTNMYQKRITSVQVPKMTEL